MPLRTITDYIKRLDSTLQKKITKHAYQQNPDLIGKWIEVSFPKIKQRALNEKTEMHC